MVENIAPWYRGAIWALREHCISPMFMHWSVSLGWLWNCNVVNQKASFLCTLYIYIYVYIVTVWYLAKCMTRKHLFFVWIYLFSFYKQIDFIYSVCLKAIMTPLLDQPEKQWPLSFNFQFVHELPPTHTFFRFKDIL